MKLNILSRIALFTGVVLAGFGCDKAQDWKPMGDAGQTIVKIPSDDDNAALAFVELTPTPQTVSLLEVRRDVVSSGALSQIMNVVLTQDPALVTAYDPDLLTVPTGVTFDASNPANGNNVTLTFAAGEFVKYVKINVANGTLFDPNESYGMGFSITSVDQSGKISASKKDVVVVIGAKNKYDGLYSYEGTIYRNSATGPDPALSGAFIGANRSLATISANSVTLVPTWANGGGIAGIDNTYITVDPATNKVTMASLGNPILANTPGEVNEYDPATKTFKLAFQWGVAPNTRVTTMTLKYLGPR